MFVTAVGNSGSYPGPQSAASCYLVQAEHHGRTWNIVLDLGSGSLGYLQRYIEPADLDAVLLTHLHPDHCLDICPLYVLLSHHPTRRRDNPMPVHAPPGAAERLARAYHVDETEPLTDRYIFTDLIDRTPLRIGPFHITPIRMRHPVATFGFRIEADGAIFAYTGDTDTTPNLTPLLRNADLVLADSAFIEGRDTVPGIHMHGRAVAQAALTAGGIKRLVLTHIPAWNDPEICRAQAATLWPNVELCHPGQRFTVTR
ncbi:MBL fold metallo-hydrolase [Dermatophilus congolensis]|uniref:MBL fold metallo-hydrolase n=1 Tax=Dermatophilus congolensis TaxID=1863 RepID=UPI001AAE9FCF|nr:MBL fold metallo-hydrolase [Dermatophilus congolensis]MBO3151511.1 MBL fold metallo-hydrolase [Dermatophilus congolensis]MBO3161487.1 MBL fold metallo-hydrolase [Dermatophilus congolensis]MBO3162796.1 MBL fold metallo-hydrolase [Dermatophilus congolensis]MBO3176350.1 MBL fold metallo-hydrolase [Dermatophilus congolensis]